MQRSASCGRSVGRARQLLRRAAAAGWGLRRSSGGRSGAQRGAVAQRKRRVRLGRASGGESAHNARPRGRRLRERLHSRRNLAAGRARIRVLCAPQSSARTRSATHSKRCVAASRRTRQAAPAPRGGSASLAAAAGCCRDPLRSAALRRAAPAALRVARLRLLKKMWSVGSAAMAVVKCAAASANLPAENAALPRSLAASAAAFCSGDTACEILSERGGATRRPQPGPRIAAPRESPSAAEHALHCARPRRPRGAATPAPR